MGGCRSLASQSVRPVARWAELTPARDRGAGWHFRIIFATSRTEVPSSTSRRPRAICSGVSFGGRPKRTPRALAATRPELVRWWMRARSNSAMPAKTVSTILAGRRGCIRPRLSQAAQAGAALLQDLRDLDIAHERQDAGEIPSGTIVSVKQVR